MSQDSENEIVDFDLFKQAKKNQLTDHGKIVYGYHLLNQRKIEEGKKILGTVSTHYYTTELYKDLSRALLCWSTYQNTKDENHRKESEFYLVVYRLTKIVIGQNLLFTNSGFFHDLKNGLFKGF